MEKIINELLRYAMDGTRASRQQAARALCDYSPQFNDGDAGYALLSALEEASNRLHTSARDVREDFNDMYYQEGI